MSDTVIYSIELKVVKTAAVSYGTNQSVLRFYIGDEVPLAVYISDRYRYNGHKHPRNLATSVAIGYSSKNYSVSQIIEYWTGKLKLPPEQLISFLIEKGWKDELPPAYRVPDLDNDSKQLPLL